MAALKQNQEVATVPAKLREREKGEASERAATVVAKLPQREKGEAREKATEDNPVVLNVVPAENANSKNTKSQTLSCGLAFVYTIETAGIIPALP